MPSPESFPSGEPTDEKAPVEAPETSTETGTDDSEVMGEKERKTYEERGEKTLEAEKATAAEKATKSELEKEREKLMEEIRMLKMRREILIKYGAKPKSERVSDDKPEETTSESDSAAAAAAAATAATVAGAATGAEKPAGEAKPEGTAEDEPASPEDIKEVKKRAKKNSAARKYAAGVCLLIAAAGIGLGIWGAAKGNRADDASLNGTPAVITVANEAGERMKGIYDGYGEKGMYLSEHKTSSVAFANATEVAEVCNADEVDMILYTAHNQVESFADYLANLPEELQPDGFKGLNLTQTEAKLESLSPEEFTALEGTFTTIMNNALTRRVTLNGRYDNAYMRVKNPGQDIVHENMELVRCTTNENNLEVTQFYWTDASGREIGNMTVKMTPVRDEKGVIESFKGCEQVVNPEGSSTIYTGMPEIPDPDTPTPPGPDTPTPPGPDTPTPPGPELHSSLTKMLLLLQLWNKTKLTSLRLNNKGKKMPLAKLRLKELPLSKPKPNAKPPLRRKLDVKLKLKPLLNALPRLLLQKLLAKPKRIVPLKPLLSKPLKSSKLAPPRKQPLLRKPLPVSKLKLPLKLLLSKPLQKLPATLMTVLPNAQIYSKMVIFRNN